MTARLDSVSANIATRFGTTPEQAVSLIEYHRVLRAGLNKFSAVAMVASEVELKGGVASEVSGVVKEGLSLIPFVGGLIGYGVDRATKAIERSAKMNGLKHALELNPAADQSEWCDFTRRLADQMVEQKAQELKQRNKSETKKSAQQDCATIIDAISNNKFSRLTIDDAELPSKMAEATGVKLSTKRSRESDNTTPSASPKKARAEVVKAEAAQQVH